MIIEANIGMQIWVVRKWQKGLLILLSVGLAGCASNTRISAPVITAKRPWSTQVRLHKIKEYYTIQPGDTLSRIARVTGSNIAALARKNSLAPPYLLYAGKVLKIRGSADDNKRPPFATFCNKIKKKRAAANTTTKPAVATPLPIYSPETAANRQIIQWHWPTDGKIIEAFSTNDGGNRGIDMAGREGQAIYGSADGRVVYAGNALHGYGNLIIIKHDEDYLSAYAHNATLLVREQQFVKAKQKIATMGSSGTHSVRLHFEIRRKGKSVDPLRYLPQR